MRRDGVISWRVRSVQGGFRNRHRAQSLAVCPRARRRLHVANTPNSRGWLRALRHRRQVCTIERRPRASSVGVRRSPARANQPALASICVVSAFLWRQRHVTTPSVVRWSLPTAQRGKGYIAPAVIGTGPRSFFSDFDETTQSGLWTQRENRFATD